MAETKPSFKVTILVGGNSWDAPAGSGKGADLKSPTGVAVDAQGIVFIADTENDRVLKRTPDGTVSVLADEIERPWTLALAPSGDLWVVAMGDLIRIAPGGERTMVFSWRVEDVSDGDVDDDAEPEGDDLPPSASAIAVDAAGTLFFTDARRNQVCKLDDDGNVVVVAGSGQAGYANGPADQAKFRRPCGIAIAPDGAIYVADDSPRLRKITLAGQVERVAGTYAGHEDGPADEAMFERLGALALGPDGTLYVSGGSTRALGPDGIVTTLTTASVNGKKKPHERIASDAVSVGQDGAIYPSGTIRTDLLVDPGGPG